MSSIFISYRRAGTSGYGGRLQEDLRKHFGKERVFRDIDSIRPGSDFALVIEQAVARSSIVLALIGSNWLNAAGGSAKRRLDDPDDFVRLEIESALSQGITVVPVLVEGATMPSPSELPPSISRLGRTQAIELTDERWDYDLNRLVLVLEEVLAAPSGPVLDQTDPAAAELMTSSEREHTDHPVGGDGDAGGVAAGTVVAGPVGGATPGPGFPDARTATPTGRGRVRLAGNRRLATVAGIVVILLTTAVLVAVTGSGEPRRKVPTVVDQDLASATATLRRIGFVVRTETRPDDTKPAGIVLAQSPMGGASAKMGTPIKLAVSIATAKPRVPFVLTLSSANATTVIQGAGLVASPVEQRIDSIAAGTVFLQSPVASTEVEAGSTVRITISTGVAKPPAVPVPTRASGTTRGSVANASGVIVPPTKVTTPGPVVTAAPPTTPGPTEPATVPTPRATTATLPPISTQNLVTNPGAEASAGSAPFTAGQPPAGWQRGSLQAMAVAYGARGQLSGCSDVAYPSAALLQGSGQQLFTGGFDAGGGCRLPAGSTPTLVQVISLAPYAGRTDGLGWEASARLASYPGSGDGAQLTIDVLGASGQVLASKDSGVVSNPPGRYAFDTKVVSGQLPPGAASVRLTLSFLSLAYSSGFADDVSFRLG